MSTPPQLAGSYENARRSDGCAELPKVLSTGHLPGRWSHPPPRPPPTRFARNHDTTAYQVLGKGPTDVVFAHAWFSHMEIGWVRRGPIGCAHGNSLMGGPQSHIDHQAFRHAADDRTAPLHPGRLRGKASPRVEGDRATLP